MILAVLLAFAAASAAAPPAPQPELLGEGVVSTPADELAPVLTADGRTLYFQRTVAPHYLYVLYESRLKGARWSAPRVLPFSGRWRDTDPVLSPDERTMLFASDRPVAGVDRHHFLIWVSRKTRSGWSEPELLPGPANDGFDQVFCSVASNGNLYFTSSRKGNVYDVYRSRREGDRYLPAEDLGPDVNGEGISTFEAAIAPDESYLLLGSFGRQPTSGSSDLYVSYNRDGKFAKPVNLGAAVNTPARDYSPRISGDGKWLLYASERLDRPPALPFTFGSFRDFSRGLYNSLGNLYRIPLGAVLEASRR